MILKVFAIHDQKVGAYRQPFFMLNKGYAARAVMNLLKDPNSEIANYPADMTLFELGEYDDSKGAMLPYEAPVSHGNVLEYKISEAQQ